VADDEDDIRSLVSFRLKRAGYELITAADGEEALLLATTRLPDLVVLDMMMPRATGLEVTCSMREQSTTTDIPIILLTHARKKPTSRAASTPARTTTSRSLSVPRTFRRCSSALRRVSLRRIGAGGAVSTSPGARAPRCR